MSTRFPVGSRAVIYTRISRDMSGEQAGVTRQSEDCHRLVDYRRWQLVEELSDNSVSAYKLTQRPGWERVLELVAAGEVDVVVAYHMDRLTRNMRDLERLILLAEESGVGVITVEGDVDLTTDMGRMIARILAAVARQEVERKGARQKRANKDRASKGLPWASGWRPFGYEKDMTQIPEEADLIRAAADDVLNGTSLKAIARRWRDAGVTTPRSEKGADGWTHNGVRSILLNPRNAGLNTYQGEVIGPGLWEPIFSEETHHHLYALLTDPKRLARTTGSAGRSAVNLLSSIARCGTCGATVNAGTSNGKRVYKCPQEHITTPRAEADDMVVTWIKQAAAMTLPGTVLALPKTVDSTHLTSQMDELKQRQAVITQGYAEGRITEDVWRTTNASINEKTGELEAELAASGDLGRDVGALSVEAIRRFDEMDLQGKRGFLMQAAEVTLHSRNRKRNVPMQNQVSLFVRTERGESKRWMPVVAEHPDARAAMKEGRSVWTDPAPARSPEEIAEGWRNLSEKTRARVEKMASQREDKVGAE